jgi:D-xylose transport system permease protein
MTAVDTATQDAAKPSPDNSLGSRAREYIAKVRDGDIGSLPAIVGLVVVVLIFGSVRPRFYTAFNFANLFQQGAAVIVIAMGLIFVLLLGEIDLSAGFTGGVCATIFTVMLTEHGVSWWISLAAALATGIVIGVLFGLLVAKVGIPSFVVTLAGFLAFQGVMLLFLSGGKNVSIRNATILAINNDSMPVWLGWTLYVIGILGYAAAQLWRIRSRTRQGLVADPMSLVAVRVGGIAIVAGLAVWALSLERSLNPLINSLKGVPIIVPVVAVLALIWSFVLSRTPYGRHLYAVGGNREAARRAGIRVDRIRMSAFIICSGMAAIGGIVIVSRTAGVDPNTGGSTVLLYAVGAAVIGGTSLFGGRGRIVDAVIGGALIAVIDNGMALLTDNSAYKYIVTGFVLLVAAGIDAVSRRRAAATGR